MIKAVIFDFDGLILDTESPVYESWLEIYQLYGCSLPISEWLKCVGTADAFDPYDYLEAQLGHALDRAELHQKRNALKSSLIDLESVMPGVEDRIAEAQALGLRLAVASSSPRSWVVENLTRLHLERHFTTIKCCEDVERVKPDPALYRETLRALSVEAAEAIVFEDSLNGVTAAKRAGIFCVAVPNAITRHSSFELADMQLSSLADMSLADLISATNGTAPER
ncbi:MAG: HAD family hydrolase [Candidatus Poribacteria bacterium]|nr:HAD family hydrolase [Candidatus Poribacteria bacterium]MDE0506363.1 HAD family hydrolase [Candidatus Poribacteria bacterium]